MPGASPVTRTNNVSAVDLLNRGLRRVPPWALYAAGAGWGGWLFWLALTGGLGVEPIDALERRYGEISLQLLVAGLAVTPLRQRAGINLMPFRRALGVLCFSFVLAHFLVWAVLDVQTLSAIWADILERPYVTIGMAGFVLLLPLGLLLLLRILRPLLMVAFGLGNLGHESLVVSLHSLVILRPQLDVGLLAGTSTVRVLGMRLRCHFFVVLKLGRRRRGHTLHGRSVGRSLFGIRHIRLGLINRGV